MNPTLPKEVKAWGEGPLRPKEISRYRDTPGQIRAADNTAGRSATRHLERFRSRLICFWQRNLSVLITARRVHYGKIGKALTTLIKFPLKTSNFSGYSKQFPAELIYLAICCKGSINLISFGYWELVVSGFQIYGTIDFQLSNLFLPIPRS